MANQKIIFNIKKTRNNEYTVQTVHTNGNVANHKYNDRDDCLNILQNYIAEIKRGDYEIVNKTGEEWAAFDKPAQAAEGQ